MAPFYKRILFRPVNYLGRRKERRCFSREPVIIAGAGRSGTTLLLSIMAAHPSLYCFRDQLSMFREWEQRTGSDGVTRWVPSRIDRLYRFLITHHIPRSATRWCDKTTHHIRFFPRILEYLEGRVRFIHLVRDGRDVVTSRHPYNPDIYWVPIERWVSDVGAGLALESDPHVLTLRYEDLVRDQRGAIERVCTFLGESCPERVLDWYKHTRVRSSRHWFGPLEQVHSRSIGRWKEPRHAARMEELMRCDEAVELLKRLGYT